MEMLKMEYQSNHFEKKLDEIRRRLDDLDSAREKLLKLSRELRKNSTLAISKLYYGDIKSAEEELERAREILNEIKEYEIEYPEIFYPITRDSMQEFVEAFVFLEIVKNKKLVIPELNIQPPSILTGLADTVGELRRYTLDLLRKGKFEGAEEMIEIMERIHSQLITFSYPDKIVPGLKGKIDMVRLAVERTKSDYISARR
jgi:translin